MEVSVVSLWMERGFEDGVLKMLKPPSQRCSK